MREELVIRNAKAYSRVSGFIHKENVSKVIETMTNVNGYFNSEIYDVTETSSYLVFYKRI